MGVLLTSEVRRIFRSPRFLIFTVGFPLVYFLIFSGIYAQGPDAAQALVALMVMMAAFGAISASISTGGRVAVERGIGWNRQLRLTPLPGWAYLVVKGAVAMIVTLPTLVLVFVVAAVVKGVDLSALTWLQVFLAAWLGVLPFAAIGLLVGLFATADSAQGMATVTMLLFSLLGGVLIPPQVLPAALASIAHALPSYWLVDVAMGQALGTGIPLEGVAVLLAWFLVIGGIVAVRYRRDALRV
ncbi:ABC transporter permease [Pseudonocardia sp. GCM10023141]|uniref:ABC transporter permease n=1 Tax=Pseudonocardia sp. GCM10023141 TaxID=3252653 RepID=UPI0036230A35